MDITCDHFLTSQEMGVLVAPVVTQGRSSSSLPTSVNSRETVSSEAESMPADEEEPDSPDITAETSEGMAHVLK